MAAIKDLFKKGSHTTGKDKQPGRDILESGNASMSAPPAPAAQPNVETYVTPPSPPTDKPVPVRVVAAETRVEPPPQQRTGGSVVGSEQPTTRHTTSRTPRPSAHLPGPDDPYHQLFKKYQQELDKQYDITQDKEEEIRRLEFELETLSQRMRGLVPVDELNDRLSNAEVESRRRIDEVTRQYDARIKSLNAEREEARKKIEDLNAHLQAANTKDQVIQQLHTQLHDAQQREHALISAHQAAIDKLKSEEEQKILGLRNISASEAQRRTELEKKVQDLERALQAEQQRVSGDLGKTRSENDHLVRELAELRDVERTLRTRIDSIQMDNAQLKKVVSEERAKIDGLAEGRMKAERQADQYRDQVLALKADLDRVRKESEGPNGKSREELAKLRGMVEASLKKIEQLNTTDSNAMGTIRELERQLEHERNKPAQEPPTTHITQVNVAHDTADLTSALDEARGKVARLEEECERLREESLSKDHMIVQKERALSENVTHNHGVITQLDKVMDERNALRNAVRAYEAALQNANHVLGARDTRYSHDKQESQRCMERLREELNLLKRLLDSMTSSQDESIHNLHNVLRVPRDASAGIRSAKPGWLSRSGEMVTGDHRGGDHGPSGLSRRHSLQEQRQEMPQQQNAGMMMVPRREFVQQEEPDRGELRLVPRQIPIPPSQHESTGPSTYTFESSPATQTVFVPKSKAGGKKFNLKQKMKMDASMKGIDIYPVEEGGRSGADYPRSYYEVLDMAHKVAGWSLIGLTGILAVDFGFRATRSYRMANKNPAAKDEIWDCHIR
ncbi:hypothetical protein HDV05_008461 [Chytridiales sp. JEL 0842]|nr:hypothetical protein HDV05_008461 [Chytridiales sp. JEL 0842]